MTSEFVLLLREVAYHPKSYMTKLASQFEISSVVRITKKDGLRAYAAPPLFDEKYLVIFEDLHLFKDAYSQINFKTMFPVLLIEGKDALEDAKFLMTEKKIPYKVYYNEFTRDMAYELVRDNASEEVSENFCKAVVRQVGLNPLRIITAVGVCSQVGYTTAALEKYVDKWVYLDVRRLIECLLGVAESNAAYRHAMLYLYHNRHWYKSVKKRVIDELDEILDLYKAKLAGELRGSNVLNYVETHGITRSRVVYASKLFERVSIATIVALREFVNTASLIEVVLKIS